MISSTLILSSRARSLGRGFTLLELIAVIAIAAIVAGIGILNSATSYQSRQRVSAQRVANDLRYARAQAVATGRSTWAKFLMSTNIIQYYQSSSVTTPLAATASTMTDPATGQTMVTTLNSASGEMNTSGVRLGTFNGATTTNWIGFDWQGRPTDDLNNLRTASVAITITASVGSTTYPACTVTVSPESGDVTLTMP